MGYHSKKIQKGVLGTPSKIQEEFEEFKDALDQNNHVMALVELSDMLGAIDSYVRRRYSITVDDLLVMTLATQSAFKDGDRKSNEQVWKCRRCNAIVDMQAFRCKCTESPSPWEPV